MKKTVDIIIYKILGMFDYGVAAQDIADILSETYSEEEIAMAFVKLLSYAGSIDRQAIIDALITETGMSKEQAKACLELCEITSNMYDSLDESNDTIIDIF